MRKLKGAVIGLGYWGPNLVRNFIKIPYVDICLVCDTSDKSIQTFKQIYPFIKTTSHFDEILKDKTIQFVAISTPLNTHFALSKKALLANKHILIEKPMTTSSDEAQELIQLANKKNKLIMVGYTFIYSEAVQKIKQNIEKKDFGKTFYYDSTRINLGRFQSDTNVIWDLAPHDFSILNYLIKEKPLTIQAMGSKHYSKTNIEIAHINITYENNISAHIYVSWLSPVKVRNIFIGGSKKMIAFNDIEPTEKVRLYNNNVRFSKNDITPFNPAYRKGSIFIPSLKGKETLFTELTHFIDCIRNNTRPLTNGNEGLKVVKLLEATNKAIITAGVIKINEEKI